MTGIQSWTCPTCNAVVTTPFCPRCGEAPVSPLDFTLRGLTERLVEAFPMRARMRTLMSHAVFGVRLYLCAVGADRLL